MYLRRFSLVARLSGAYATEIRACLAFSDSLLKLLCKLRASSANYKILFREKRWKILLQSAPAVLVLSSLRNTKALGRQKLSKTLRYGDV